MTFDIFEVSNNIFKNNGTFLKSSQYIGTPIVCDSSTDAQIVNIFCWTNGTYITKKSIGPSTYDQWSPGGGYVEKVYFKMYQWVATVLIVQVKDKSQVAPITT